jgi:hypothetical protein
MREKKTFVVVVVVVVVGQTRVLLGAGHGPEEELRSSRSEVFISWPRVWFNFMIGLTN